MSHLYLISCYLTHINAGVYDPKCLFSVSSITSFCLPLCTNLPKTHLMSFHSRLWEKQVYWRLTLGCVTVSVKCENPRVTLLGPSWWTRHYSEGVKSFVYLWRHCYANHSSNASLQLLPASESKQDNLFMKGHKKYYKIISLLHNGCIFF